MPRGSGRAIINEYEIITKTIYTSHQDEPTATPPNQGRRRKTAADGIGICTHGLGRGERGDESKPTKIKT
jgi:hypothetical protein